MSKFRDIYEIIKRLKGLVEECSQNEMQEKLVVNQEGFFNRLGRIPAFLY
ncbi:MAG: hypothetical protein PUC76_02940 [Clostridia bacterium]|nr:hypothetical protein [Clostridia bacterium]